MGTIPAEVLQEANLITARLVNTLLIEQIYLNDIVEDDKAYWELIILIPNSSTQHITEARPLVRMVMTLHIQFRYRLFYFHDVKAGLKQGSMVFFSICQPDMLVYINPESDIPLFNNKTTFQKVYNRAIIEQGKERNKIRSFREGMDFYFEKGNDQLCALMLHQVFELCYRFAELALIGKEKISHSLRNHHKFLLPYIPELKTLFNEEDEKEMSILFILDEAYLTVRYENSYQISKDELSYLIQKSLDLQQIVDENSRLAQKQFEVRFGNYKEEEQQSEPSSEQEVATSEKFISSPTIEPLKPLCIMEKIIEKITREVGTIRIYCMGKSSRSFSHDSYYMETTEKTSEDRLYLLVITKDEQPNDIYRIQSYINQDKNVDAKVVLLFHSMASITKALENGNPFFQRVITTGEQVFINKDLSEIWQIPTEEKKAEVNLETKKMNWWKRRRKIIAFIESASNLTYDDNEDVELCMLALALEQICLAYIETFLDYKPNLQSLSHLYNLCDYISEKANEFFPRITEEDIRLFGLLSQGLHNLRFRSSLFYHPTDVAILHRRCEYWLEFVTEEVESYLKEQQ
ncbi:MULTISPECIES: hypothetical protein [Olivibacter]|uniref:HEPN domain-containing protein n=1 Tax=Olivibacter oleidegradans TaxID=760123 RepID=A0ABV6HGW1_9SPHI|nr:MULTISPECIES: hypothetical protein [Olivibacter]QEK99883.1 hypothetical protein FKG96_03385 [Olivibacter sp. LS-1]